MKLIIIIIGLSIQTELPAQSQNTVDSLVNEICLTITNDQNPNDSIRLFSGYVSHILAHVENNPDDNVEDFWNSIFLRLQVKCKEFINLSIRLNKHNDNWIFVSEMPATSLSEFDCSEFYQIKKYKYIEPTGDTTSLKVNKRYWKDMLSDGTYSKLKLTKKTECDFDLTFIKSNNQIKNKLSIPGDKYRYRLIERNENYFLLGVEIETVNKVTLFKVYYK